MEWRGAYGNLKAMLAIADVDTGAFLRASLPECRAFDGHMTIDEFKAYIRLYYKRHRNEFMHTGDFKDFCRVVIYDCGIDQTDPVLWVWITEAAAALETSGHVLPAPPFADETLPDVAPPENASGQCINHDALSGGIVGLPTDQQTGDSVHQTATQKLQFSQTTAPVADAPAALPVIEAAASAFTGYVDPELMRLSVALDTDVPARLWYLARWHCAGKNHLKAGEFITLGMCAGISRNTAKKALNNGTGTFWNVDRRAGKVYLRSYEFVALRLTDRALMECPAAVSTNQPGKQARHVTLSGGVADVRAGLYAAWMDMKADPTISRFTLCSLWNVDADTLRAWEKYAGIEVTHSYVQYAGEDNTLIPTDSDGEARADVHTYQTAGATRLAWRGCNRYTAPSFREKQTGKRAVKRVAALCRELVESAVLPDNDSGVTVPDNGHSVGLHRTKRIHFNSNKGSAAAYKSAQRHIRWHGDTSVRHYVTLGQHSYKGSPAIIVECVAAGCIAPLTAPFERFTVSFPRAVTAGSGQTASAM